MYITLDFYCRRCGRIEERFIDKDDIEEQYCAVCDDVPVHALPSATPTTFTFADNSPQKK